MPDMKHTARQTRVPHEFKILTNKLKDLEFRRNLKGLQPTLVTFSCPAALIPGTSFAINTQAAKTPSPTGAE